MSSASITSKKDFLLVLPAPAFPMYSKNVYGSNKELYIENPSICL
jgi:hypothetical protein